MADERPEKKRLGSIIATVVVVLVVIAIGFALGWAMGERRMAMSTADDLKNVQAMLVFNRILDERRLQGLVSSGCANQAADELDYTLDKDTELLSHYVSEGIDAQTQKYISDRDHNLLNAVRTFKSKYGDSWVEKACQPK